MLARLGVGHLTVLDGDVFDETNLNRQLYSDEASIGKSKALKAKDRVAAINSSIAVEAHILTLTADNAPDILRGHDAVIDAVDSIEARCMLQDACEEAGIPFIHGAIAGWYGQVTTIYPGDRTLDLLYAQGTRKEKGIEKQLGNPSFTPALVASIEVSEAVKVLIGKGETLRKRVLYIDTLAQEYNVVELES
jgi:molybdopterin/thiamine biosynthesis adenylyltransferase